MKKNIQFPLIGASIPTGISAVHDFLKMKLGNIILTAPPENKKDAVEMMKLCKDKHIYVVFSEIMQRGSQKRKCCHDFTKKDIDEIIAAAGEYYWGRYTIGEAGGILYWPKAYVMGRGVCEFSRMPECDSAEEAHERYVKYLKDLIHYERENISNGNLINVESSFLFNYHVEAGIDMLCLEMLPGDVFRMIPAIRGSANAYRRNWGIHIALGWYGGVKVDDIWLKRWKLSLYYSFISGAEYIYPESGHYDYTAEGRQDDNYGFDHPKMKAARKILREFWRFSQIHRRPKNGPNVSIGIVFGNHEGCPGLWNPYAWGQYENGEKWEAGPAEKGWEILDSFFKAENCFRSTLMGDISFSGNPPLGQFDIVPVECSLEKLKKYKCLAFIGWNNITDMIYEKLVEYVKSGGHLLMWLSHFNIEKKRGAEINLFRDGNIEELFGVKIEGKEKTDIIGIKYFCESSVKSYKMPYTNTNMDPSFIGKMTPAKTRIVGKHTKVLCGFSEFFTESAEYLSSRPALVENRIGRGCAWLVTAFEHPGDDGMKPFAENLFRVVLSGEQNDIRLIGSDRIRYAVYNGKIGTCEFMLLYMLNTEFDVSQAARIYMSGTISDEISIPANSMKMVYLIKDSLIVSPELKDFEIHSIKAEKNSIDIGFFSLEKQNIQITNISEENYRIHLNDMVFELSGGKTAILKCPCKFNPKKLDFYSEKFLSEPKIKSCVTKLPY